MTGLPTFHVITGGPGSGKTTLIDALATQGIRHMPEAGRAIIREQVAIGGTALPWADRTSFADLMLAWELRSWHEAAAFSGPVIFDRGVPDVIGYLRLPSPSSRMRGSPPRSTPVATSRASKAGIGAVRLCRIQATQSRTAWLNSGLA